uniref:Uncharacterized protein n=1 Tax=Anguilla anguilla TaxID=7936 RepID=A0A0E9TBF9_ANGAN
MYAPTVSSLRTNNLSVYLSIYLSIECSVCNCSLHKNRNVRFCLCDMCK